MGQGLAGSEGRGANVLLSGGLAISCDGNALRDSRSAGPMCGDGYPWCVAACASRSRPSLPGKALRPLVVLLLNASCS
jgi:hypothetical protein